MNKATQGLKTTKYAILGVFLLLAAAIGFFGFTQHDRASSSTGAQKPQVTQIQKQPPVTSLPLQKARVMTESRTQYTVQSGDTFWSIASMMKPTNVETHKYVGVLKELNGKYIHVGKDVILPTNNDLANVMLPDVEVQFDYLDESIVAHIKEAEGNSVFQSKNKRRLLGGKVGVSFYGSKFYPYKDMKGNYTIGYGHYLGKKDSDAMKYRNGITKAQATKLLKQDMKRTYDDFTLLLQRKHATNLTKEQQRVLYEMAFTMGVDKLATFGKLWKSVKNDNQARFKHEITSSLWYKQVQNRADILVSSL